MLTECDIDDEPIDIYQLVQQQKHDGNFFENLSVAADNIKHEPNYQSLSPRCSAVNMKQVRKIAKLRRYDSFSCPRLPDVVGDSPSRQKIEKSTVLERRKSICVPTYRSSIIYSRRGSQTVNVNVTDNVLRRTNSYAFSKDIEMKSGTNR